MFDCTGNTLTTYSTGQCSSQDTSKNTGAFACQNVLANNYAYRYECSDFDKSKVVLVTTNGGGGKCATSGSIYSQRYLILDSCQPAPFDFTGVSINGSSIASFSGSTLTIRDYSASDACTGPSTTTTVTMPAFTAAGSSKCVDDTTPGTISTTYQILEAPSAASAVSVAVGSLLSVVLATVGVLSL